ncbi:dynamin, partial [Caerostris extrusa]
LKLTLVDLPGLVRVVVDGQPESSIQEVRDMILSYISQPESLILAVTPANQDLATSDALEIARKVDPDRLRTIGVLTKLDIMDEGTDARDILENRQVTLKRGWVGVLNRSQLDIEEGRDIQFILDKEKRFFAGKQSYRHIAERMGTPYLQRMLQRILKTHIKAALPDVRNRLAEKLAGYQRQLREFENNIGEDSGGKGFYMIKLVNTFIEDITIKLMGNSELVGMKQLSPGAYINYKLNTEIQNNLKLILEPNEEEMTILITSLDGVRCSISFPSLSVDAVNRQLVSQYAAPMEQSVESIKNILEEAIAESATLLNRYPSTKAEVLYRIRCSLQKEMESTQCKLREHVKAEMSYVNLEHPDLDLSVCDPLVPAIGPTKMWQTTTQTSPPPDSDPADPDSTASDSASPSAGPAPSSLEKDIHNGLGDGLNSKAKDLVQVLMNNGHMQKKVQYLMLVMTKYMEIIQKQITDLTIKYILCFLVRKVLDYIKIDLVPTLLDSANFSSLSEDCEETPAERRRWRRPECLKGALATIQAF